MAQGFINNINNTRHYYHFTREVHDDLISYPNINPENIHDLGYTGHYSNLMGERDQSIYWQNIASSFFEISNVGTTFESQRPVVQASLGRIVLVTSELLRFGRINNLINNNIISDSDGPIYWNPSESSGYTNIRNIVTNWQTISNNIIDVINNIQSRFGVIINGDHIFDREFYNLLSELPTNILWQLLRITDVRVILGLIMQPVLNCDRRRARNINNDIKNEYCDAIKDLNQDYNLGNKKITVVKILEKNKYGQELTPGHLKAGDIYVGTTEGIYLIRDLFGSNRVEQFDDLLNFSIKNIIIDDNCNAYALSDKNDIFYLRYTKGLGWTASKIFLDNDKFSKKINIINMKEILKNSDDGYLKAGDIYVQTDNGNYLIHNNQQTEKITINKHYFIKHDDNTITTVHFNREDNSYCHSSGKKLLPLALRL